MKKKSKRARTKPLRATIQVRDLIALLGALNCVPVRTRGSHGMWRTPAGAVLAIVVHHRNATVSRSVFSSIQRVLRAEGLLDEEGADR